MGVPGENHPLTPSHWQLSHMPYGRCNLNLGSSKRHLAASGNVLDHTAIRAGPWLYNYYIDDWWFLYQKQYEGEMEIKN